MIYEFRVIFGQTVLHFLITKSPIRNHFLKFCSDGFFGGFQCIQQKFGVGTDFFKEFPVNNESVSVFSKEQRVPVFNFGSAFASYEDFRTCLVDAEDFFRIGNAAFTDDAFVGLLDGLGEEF